MNIAQGDVWWAEAESVGRRPVLVLTRNRAIPVLRTLLVAPLTRTVRGLPSEVPLGPDDGVVVECVASFDNVATIPVTALTARAGALGPGRWPEVCAAMSAVIDC